MNSVIAKLAEIEEAAEAIVAHAWEQKAVIEKDLQNKRNVFDQEIEEETQKKIAVIRKEGEEKMEKILEEQRQKNHSTIELLEKEYEENHNVYADEILRHMIEV